VRSQDSTRCEDTVASHAASRDKCRISSDNGPITYSDRLPFVAVSRRRVLVVEQDGGWTNEHAVSKHTFVGDVGRALDATSVAEHRTLADVGKCTNAAISSNDGALADVTRPPCNRAGIKVNTLT
jgi:hypothetical protein